MVLGNTPSTANLLANVNVDQVPTLTAASGAVLKNFTVSGSTISDQINQDSVNVSTAQTYTASTSLSAIPGMSVPLTASGNYNFQARFPCSAGAAGGVKLSLDTSDTLTLTSLSMQGKFITANAIASSYQSSFQSGIGSTAAVLIAELEGSLVVNAAGTLIIKGAQNAASSTTTLYAGGTLDLTRTA